MAGRGGGCYILVGAAAGVGSVLGKDGGRGSTCVGVRGCIYLAVSW